MWSEENEKGLFGNRIRLLRVVLVGVEVEGESVVEFEGNEEEEEIIEIEVKAILLLLLSAATKRGRVKRREAFLEFG